MISEIKKRPPIHVIEEILSSKKYIRESIPPSLSDTILNKKKIVYRGKSLKTSKLSSVCDLLLKKYEQKRGTSGDNVIILNAELLQKRFGCNYKYYINYLINNDYIKRHLGYKPGFKSTTYRLTNKMCNVVPITYFNYDKVTIKKYIINVLSGVMDGAKINMDILKKIDINNTSIPNYILPDIRSKLIMDLYNIEIDLDKSYLYIDGIKDKVAQYYNRLRILDIYDKHIWYQFDNYGRFHTNYTVIKSIIRKKCLTINGDNVMELDIKNSQPLLLAKIIKDSGEIGTIVDSDEYNYFAELVKSGELYNHFITTYKYKDRKDVKKNLIYKVIFGDNLNNKNKANRTFMKSFPTIYKFIVNYKLSNDNYKCLSHKLQRSESNLIFNKIIKDIMLVDINISIFTIHDSICFPESYNDVIAPIFNKHIKYLIDSI